MFRLAIGFVIGYILGAKAGHERFEQIRRLTSTVSTTPPSRACLVSSKRR